MVNQYCSQYKQHKYCKTNSLNLLYLIKPRTVFTSPNIYIFKLPEVSNQISPIIVSDRYPEEKKKKKSSSPQLNVIDTFALEKMQSQSSLFRSPVNS